MSRWRSRNLRKRKGRRRGKTEEESVETTKGHQLAHLPGRQGNDVLDAICIAHSTRTTLHGYTDHCHRQVAH